MSVFVTQWSRSVGSAASCSSSGNNPPDAHGRSMLGFSEASISQVDEMLFSLYQPPYLEDESKNPRDESCFI
jgi:hypothetical protein